MCALLYSQSRWMNWNSVVTYKKLAILCYNLRHWQKNMVEIGKLSTGVTFSEKFSVISYKENNWKFVYTLSIIFVNKGIYLIKACSECT